MKAGAYIVLLAQTIFTAVKLLTIHKGILICSGRFSEIRHIIFTHAKAKLLAIRISNGAFIKPAGIELLIICRMLNPSEVFVPVLVALTHLGHVVLVIFGYVAR